MLTISIFYGIAILGVYLVVAYLTRGKQEKYLGKYTVPNLFYPLKYWFFYCLIKLRSKLPQDDSSPGGYGKKSKGSIGEMEVVQTLSSHKYAIDASYFNGYNPKGWYFGAGIQRRHYQKAESLMFIRVPAGILNGPQSEADILEWTFSPATDCDMRSQTSWSADDLEYDIVEPMKTWRVRFDGKLKERRGQKIRKVKFNLEWKATGPYFDFDTDMDIRPTCEAIATEPWSRDFFDRLKEAHQTHYEQFGILKGDLEIEGVGAVPLELNSMRDRTYGKFRNWYDFNRYILQYFAFEDGTCVAFHLINFAILMTHLVTGFVITPDGKKLAIVSSTKRLWEIGEKEPPPKDYEIGVTVQGGLKYNFKVHLVETPQYYCGWDWEARLHSVMAEIDCTMPDGSHNKGQGMCEFEYRHRSGRTDNRKPVPVEAMGE